MIVLDANVIIGFLDATDAHHVKALRVLEDSLDEEYAASVLTVAEALVHPARQGLDVVASRALADIGLEVLPLTSDDAVALARVRAQFHVRMPDAVALHAALTAKSRIATFDSRLAAAARKAGIDVVSGE